MLIFLFFLQPHSGGNSRGATRRSYVIRFGFYLRVAKPLTIHRSTVNRVENACGRVTLNNHQLRQSLST
jgi:hypothetical protein